MYMYGDTASERTRRHGCVAAKPIEEKKREQTLK